MTKLRLNRRALLRGAGGVAIALPWLEAMEPERSAEAQTAAAAPAKRFLAVYQPGGTVLSKWRPSGTEAAPVYGPILKPLETLKSKILVLDGLDLKCAASGEQHQGGIVGLLTGSAQNATKRMYSSVPSIDQVIATRISAGKKAKSSIQVAVRWATGKSHGLLHPINSLNFEDNAAASPIPPRLDPVEIWNDLFGALNPEVGSDAGARLQRKKSVLDFLDRKYAALSARLGAADRAKLDQHLEKIREIEKGLDAATGGGTTQCKAPTLINTSDYNPKTGLNADNNGAVKDTSTDAAIPKVGKLMMDMLVMAFACDLTGVATFQWSDTEAKHTFPWLSLSEHHHYYQHDGGFKPAECEKICTWYSEQHFYLLNAMNQVDMGGHSLLDESVVFFGSELQEPPTHKKDNMPFLLAGGGGGLRGGRYLKYANLPHNHLLASILNLFGDPRPTFGDPQFATGRLSNLT